MQRVAPFLEVDGDPYPAVIDGKIKWIVDAYTTSPEYPYSTPQVLQEATQDSYGYSMGAAVLEKWNSGTEAARRFRGRTIVRRSVRPGAPGGDAGPAVSGLGRERGGG